MSLRGSLFSLLAVVSLFALSACGKRASRIEEAKRAGVIYIGVGSEPSDLDPQIVTGLAEAKIVPALFDGLVTFDPETLAPAPSLAERWEITPDGLTYTFHLRANAKWSNGEIITAQDVIDSWHRALTPTLAADYAYFFYLIRGGEAFHKGQNKDFSAVGLAAPDAQTLVVQLAHPAPYFLQLLLNPPWRPVHVRSIAKVGDAYQRGTPWTKPDRMVTSGPFVLKEWITHQHVVVEKSPTYWDRDRVRLNGIHFFPIDSTDAEERAYRAEQLHVTYNLPLSKVEPYRRDHPESLRIDPYVDTYFFRMNTRRAPLDDARFRRALSLAIDRDIIAQKILHGGQKPATSFVPPTIPGYTPPVFPTRDLAAARKLLAELGHADGKDLPPIEILYNNSDILRQVAEAVQEMWRRDLGLNVTLQNQEYKVVFANRRAGQYQILLSDWVADYLDPTTFLDIWRSESGNNHTGWKSADYDALMNEAAASADPVARATLLAKAETLMLEAAPIAPIYFNTHVYLVHPSVKGWAKNPMDNTDFRNVWLE